MCSAETCRRGGMCSGEGGDARQRCGWGGVQSQPDPRGALGLALHHSGCPGRGTISSGISRRCSLQSTFVVALVCLRNSGSLCVNFEPPAFVHITHFLKKILFIYFKGRERERERESAQEWGSGRTREKGTSRLHAEHRAQHGARSHDPAITT